MPTMQSSTAFNQRILGSCCGWSAEASGAMETTGWSILPFNYNVSVYFLFFWCFFFKFGGFNFHLMNHLQVEHQKRLEKERIRLTQGQSIIIPDTITTEDGTEAQILIHCRSLIYTIVLGVFGGFLLLIVWNFSARWYPFHSRP